MESESTEFTRRTVLGAAGGSLAALGTSGLAGAGPAETVEVNVGYDAESGRQAALAAAEEVVREFGFDALTLRLPKRAADALADRADVRYVEENGTMHALGQSLPWGVDRIDANQVHDMDTGQGIDLAVIDSGIDSDHDDLQANLGSGKAFVDCGGDCQCILDSDCEFPNGNTCHEPWDDDNDHGTHVAGIAGAVDNSRGVLGTAPDVTLHAVKVLGRTGCGRFSKIAAGIEYVADQGWDVANMSLGGGQSDCVEDAVEKADSQGVVLVAAAGNSGPCSDCVGYPAAQPEVLAVSATTSDDSLAEFSSTGPEIDVAAPGKDVPSTVPGNIEEFSGTSMASPHVAGTAAILLSAGVSVTETKFRLKDSAEDLGLGSNEQGGGLVDAFRSYPIFEVDTESAFPEPTSITFQGDLVDLEFADSADVYFEYGRASFGLTDSTTPETLTTTGIFEHTVGAVSDTTYVYEAVAESSDGQTTRGGVKQVNTPSDDDGGRK